MGVLTAKADHRRRQLRSLLDVARLLGPSEYLRVAKETGNAPQVAEEVRNSVYRSIWHQAASSLESECFDLGDGFLEIRSGGAVVRLWQQLIPSENPVALRLALHKGVVHGMLVQAGLAAPEHIQFDAGDLPTALGFMEAQGGAFVIKPAGGTAGGDGTTCGVSTRAELEMALRRASLFGNRVLVERQAPGDVFRLLFLEGELLDVVRRRSPTLVGDGRSTIGELIGAENRRRLEAQGSRGLALLRLDLDCAIALRQAGMTLASVPAAGVVVRVKTATGEARIEDSETYRGPLSQAVVEDARRAVALTGPRLAGVDVITTDLGLPLGETGGVIAEVNGTPGLHHHYHVADGANATQVAIPVLRYVIDAAIAAETRAVG